MMMFAGMVVSTPGLLPLLWLHDIKDTEPFNEHNEVEYKSVQSAL